VVWTRGYVVRGWKEWMEWHVCAPGACMSNSACVHDCNAGSRLLLLMRVPRAAALLTQAGGCHRSTADHQGPARGRWALAGAPKGPVGGLTHHLGCHGLQLARCGMSLPSKIGWCRSQEMQDGRSLSPVIEAKAMRGIGMG
jgi:hypothetical protein